MAISTPFKFQLNFMGLESLNFELTKWEGIAATLYGQDLIDAQAYIEAVRAERDQRAEQYKGGTFGAIIAGFKAPFETVGGSTGPGATGILGESSAALGAGASSVAAGARKYSYIIIGAVVILAGFFIWLRFKK